MGESSNCVHSMKDFELKYGSSARSSSSSMGALASCGTPGDSILGVKLWEPIFGSSALFLSFTRLWASSSGVSSNSINSMQNWESISGSSAKLISSNMRSFLTGGTPGDCIITVNVGNFIFGNLAPFVSVGKLSAPSSGVSNNCINSEKLWDSVSGSKSESILSSVSSLGSSGILASSAEHFLLELSRPPFVKGVLQAPHLYRVVRRCHYWSTGTWRFRISRNVGSDTKRLHYLGVVPRMQPQSSRSLEDVSSFVRRDCEWNICGTPSTCIWVAWCFCCWGTYTPHRWSCKTGMSWWHPHTWQAPRLFWASPFWQPSFSWWCLDVWETIKVERRLLIFHWSKNALHWTANLPW